MPKISNLPPDSLPTLDDYIIVNDATSNSTKKVTLGALFSNQLIGTTGLANNAVTSAKMSPSKAYDGSWQYYDFGAFRFYRYSYAVNISVTNGQRNSPGTLSIPSTVSDYTQWRLYLSWEGNYSGHAVVGAEAPTSSGWVINIGNQYSGSALTFNGSIRCLLIPI